jgi:proline dehydrogenase
MGLLIRLAATWVAGEEADDALRAAREANRRGVGAILNRLGEHYRERSPAEADLREYLALVRAIRDAGIEGCLSVKPTQFGILVDRDFALSQYLTVLDAMKAHGMRLWLDMESSATTDTTLWLYEHLIERYGNVGVCLQANLRRTDADLSHLLALGGKIRLTKGAYREPGEIAFTTRAEVDRQYLRLLERLFLEGRDFAVASHDGRMIARAMDLGASMGVPFEFQFLKGVRDPMKVELVAKGSRVLEYIPYGPTWLRYFLRRLRERPRNVATMVRSLVGS